MNGRQLPLSLRLPDGASFDNFLAGPNAAAVAALQRPCRDVLLVGAAGSGKSHLLQAALRQAQAGAASVGYLPLAGIDAALIETAAECALLAIDELERLDGGQATRLLRLLDLRRAHARVTLLASRERPERLEPLRRDLRTRLSQAACYALAPLDDEARSRLLIRRARQRGLQLPPEVARWLLTQLPRDAGSLVSALDRLDRASLQAKRRLTIPFVRQALLDAPPPTT